VAAKEREVLAREASLLEREANMTALLSQKDAEIASLQTFVSQLQQQLQVQVQFEKDATDDRIREAISKREEELRLAVMKREEEVAAAITRREEEIMDAVKAREEEVFKAWKAREEQIRNEMVSAVEERVTWVNNRAEELRMEEAALIEVKKELESKIKMMDEGGGKRKRKLFSLDCFSRV
jgi:NIMA (never in mitosis gene a)-related kinase 2